MTWTYLIVDVENKGRTISENGKVTDSHTKKSDSGELSPLPRNMWNAKGKKMIEAAKGALLNEYGSDGWELVSVYGDGSDNCFKYFFKRKKD